MRYCSNCGKPVGESENFCTYCGYELTNSRETNPGNDTDGKKQESISSKQNNEHTNFFTWIRMGMKGEKLGEDVSPIYGFVAQFLTPENISWDQETPFSWAPGVGTVLIAICVICALFNLWISVDKNLEITAVRCYYY